MERLVNSLFKPKRIKILGFELSGVIETVGKEVTKFKEAVCSTKNIDMVKSLGAAKAIGYKTQDFTDTKDRYDLVFDTVNKTSKKECKKILKKDGR